MSDNFFDPLWTEKVTVPVKRVGDTWEFFYGGDVPVKEGTLGELSFSVASIADEAFRQRVTSQVSFKILEEDTSLMVALSDRFSSKPYAEFDAKHFPQGIPVGTSRWARVRLGPPKEKKGEKPAPSAGVQQSLIPEKGGLWLKLKGLEKCELVSSTVLMPDGFPEPTATSLNHAFTMLSREYEKHRISNTGNVYTRVFYQDRDDCWYPLDDLRRGVQAKVERTLLNELWAEVEKVLGWRPLRATQRQAPMNGMAEGMNPQTDFPPMLLDKPLRGSEVLKRRQVGPSPVRAYRHEGAGTGVGCEWAC